MSRNRQAGIVAAAAVLVGGMMFPLTGRSVFAAEALSAKDLFAKVSPAVVRVIAYGKEAGQMKQESGFIVADGLVVTNHRFLENAKNAMIELSRGGSRVVVKGFAAEDVPADMVLLSVAFEGSVKPAALADKRPAVGAKVFFISRPVGRSTGISPGLVTGFRDVSKALTVMQCGIQVPDGSGGGPVFSDTGLVLGAAAPALGTDKDRGIVVLYDRLTALLNARDKVRPLSELSRSPGMTRRYNNLGKALAEIPAKFFPARNVKFNNMQRDMVNKWFKENLIGAEVLVKGCLAAPPSGGSGGVEIRFPTDRITVHRKLLELHMAARFDGSYALELSKLKKGSSITLHGTLAGDGLNNKSYPYHMRWIIRLEGCAPGPFPKPVRHLPPPKGGTTKPVDSSEKKAGRQLRMAKAYMGVGKNDQARVLLKAIIKDYPKTKAATEAKELLGKLK